MRRFGVDAPRVFDAWLSCELLGRWMFGPAVRDEEIVHLSLDPHVGGAFSFMVARDDEEIEHAGKYLAIERPRRLVFTWWVQGEKAGSRVTVELAPRDDGCELTLTHELHPDWIERAGLVQAGWNRMFDVLAAVLASRAATRE